MGIALGMTGIGVGCLAVALAFTLVGFAGLPWWIAGLLVLPGLGLIAFGAVHIARCRGGREHPEET